MLLEGSCRVHQEMKFIYRLQHPNLTKCQRIPALPLTINHQKEDEVIPISDDKVLESLLNYKQPKAATLHIRENEVSFYIPEDLALHELDLEKIFVEGHYRNLGNKTKTNSTG